MNITSPTLKKILQSGKTLIDDANLREISNESNFLSIN